MEGFCLFTGENLWYTEKKAAITPLDGGDRMSVDHLQDKIRKLKNPSVLELGIPVSQLPPHLLEEEGSAAAALARFCRELLDALKGTVPAVRLSFSAFALLGPEGLAVLRDTAKLAGQMGCYVLMDAPEIFSPAAAQWTAEALLGGDSWLPCDGVVIGGYLGSDVIKPFLPYCKKGKDLFVAVRTANKSASELQDLLSGTRQVHAAAADHVNRYGAGTAGKSGYTRVGVLAAASAADSLRNLRGKYPGLFLLVDGYDYPNANAKNCSNGFDKFGHGAAVCGGTGITCAWKDGEADGEDYLTPAKAAAERMKKNLTRYVTVL